MSEANRMYTNGEVTVIWKPEACIHSRLCWTQLGEVFDPRKRPWVNMEGADTARIIQQVTKCPSGALTCFLNEAPDTADSVEPETKVQVMPNGPLLVHGKLTIKLKDGAEETRNKVTAFCRCGQSGNKPFCDGSHSSTGFEDQ